MKQSIGDFLLRRLQEVGIRHLFGVPGDYNLGLMKQLEDRGEPARLATIPRVRARGTGTYGLRTHFRSLAHRS